MVGFDSLHTDYNYAFGFDTAQLLSMAMQACVADGFAAANTSCLKRVLPSMKFRGKTGIVDMNGTRVALTESHLYQLEGQRLVRVG
ncbi:hypothetical protein AUJ14_03575 [Candidatus Micrarchaeota archaeon CG1_02_55_22]|nr:MAG: hypothetical protein AUJ14_03575 [Candidatus Micrarchaeota archaeon CG1_02_55_22]